MLPKARLPGRNSCERSFGEHCLKLAESVFKLSAVLDQPLTLAALKRQKTRYVPLPGAAAQEPPAGGYGLHETITELINRMSEIVATALTAPEGRKGGGRKRRRLLVPDMLSQKVKGFHPRESIRASRKKEALKQVYQNNVLSSSVNLGDVDSALEMIEFVNDHILSPRQNQAKPRERCLTQKALALLL